MKANDMIGKFCASTNCITHTAGHLRSEPIQKKDATRTPLEHGWLSAKERKIKLRTNSGAQE